MDFKVNNDLYSGWLKPTDNSDVGETPNAPVNPLKPKSADNPGINGLSNLLSDNNKTSGAQSKIADELKGVGSQLSDIADQAKEIEKDAEGKMELIKDLLEKLKTIEAHLAQIGNEIDQMIKDKKEKAVESKKQQGCLETCNVLRLQFENYQDKKESQAPQAE